MSRHLFAAVLLPCLAAVPAHADPFQPCTVTLFTAQPRSGEEALSEARRQIAAHRCAPGDPLVVVGTGFQPMLLAASLCRRGASVQISDMPDTEDHTRQVDCELPARSTR